MILQRQTSQAQRSGKASLKKGKWYLGWEFKHEIRMGLKKRREHCGHRECTTAIRREKKLEPLKEEVNKASEQQQRGKEWYKIRLEVAKRPNHVEPTDYVNDFGPDSKSK